MALKRSVVRALKVLLAIRGQTLLAATFYAGRRRAQVMALLFGWVPTIVRDLHHGMQRNFQPRCRGARQTHQIRVQHTQDSLMRHDEQRLVIRLHLMHQRIQPSEKVEVALTTRVAVAYLIHGAQRCFVRLQPFDVFVRHPLVLAGEDLVKIAVDSRRHLLPHVFCVLQLCLSQARVWHQLVRQAGHGCAGRVQAWFDLLALDDARRVERIQIGGCRRTAGQGRRRDSLGRSAASCECGAARVVRGAVCACGVSEAEHRVGDVRRRQNCPLQRRRPQTALDQLAVHLPYVLRHPGAQPLCILRALLGERRVPSDLAQYIVLGLAVA
mmetsp:Transcript_34292/g.83322  ORF Transcript_34292/g.83322 Transcript_34292/m.83322 type:complete len:326 (-) Transcript_34292:1049-2026(-)